MLCFCYAKTLSFFFASDPLVVSWASKYENYMQEIMACESFVKHLVGSLLGGKSFGFVSINIECKNISISGDIGGFILSTK